MESETLDITVTDGEYSLVDDELTFQYVQKEDGDQKVERYQVSDDLGVIFSGEKIWKTEGESYFFGILGTEKEVYEDEVQKRVGYDTSSQSVITEQSNWQAFQDFLAGTEAANYIISD